MTTLVAEKREFEVLPTGEYLAEFIDYEDAENKFGPEPRFKMTFEIVSPKAYAGKQRCGWCSQKLTGGKKPSKLWKWVEAFYNRPLTFGESVNLDAMIGRQAVMVLVEKPNDEGENFNNVEDFKPYKKAEPFPVGQTEPSDEFEVGPKDDEEVDPFADQ